MHLRWIAIFLICTIAFADEAPPDRGLRLGLSASHLTSQPAFESQGFAPGVWTSYEFLLSPRFSLGIHASFKSYSADAALRQLTYGLLLKHTFGEASVTPYAEYGLLMNMNFISDRPGSGASHDTRLAAGVEFSIGSKRFFSDLGYHYSRLGFFSAERINLDALELTLGWKYTWN